MSEQWMSIVEYARNFSISDMTVRRRIKNGKLPAVLKEGKYYIRVGDSQDTPKTVTTQSHQNLVTNPAPRPQTSPIQEYSQTPATSFQPRTESNYEKPGPARGGASGTASSFSLTTPVSTRPSRDYDSSDEDRKKAAETFEKALKKLEQNEQRLQDHFEGKIDLLEERMKLKDLEIRRLREQVIDLQTLINMLQQKSTAKAG